MLRKACSSRLLRITSSYRHLNTALNPQISSTSATIHGKQQHPVTILDHTAIANALQTALSRRNIQDAWQYLQAFRKLGKFPERSAVNNSLLLFAYAGDDCSLTRALKLVSRLQEGKRLDLLDVDSLSLLALAFSRAEKCDLAGKILRILVHDDFFPSVNVWTASLELLAKKPPGAAVAVTIFHEICIRIREKRRESNDFDNLLLAMQPNKPAFYLALNACVMAGESKKAEDIINEMRHLGLPLDNPCFIPLIKVYEKEKNMKALNMILPRLRQASVVPSKSTLSALLSAFVNLGNVDVAAQLVRGWLWSSRKPKNDSGSSKELLSYWNNSLENIDSKVYAILLKGFINSKRTLDAADFLVKMQEEDSSDYIDCSFAIDGLLQMGLRDEAHDIVQAMAAQNAPADCSNYVALIKAYCKIPYPDKAETVFEDAKKVGHQLPIDCYEAMIEMHILIQEYESALSIFKSMKRSGLYPLEPSFLSLLEMFRQNFKPYLMRKLIEVAIRDPPIRVEPKHWNACIQCFCKARMMFDAKVAVRRMKELQIRPDATTYAIVLNGYYSHRGKVNEMLVLWLEVLGLAKPKEGVEPLKLSRDLLEGFLTVFIIYGYFKKALEVVAKMEEENFVCDKTKYRELYLEHHRHTFTSKHASQRRVDKSQQRREQNNFFRNWLGLSCVE